MKNSKKSLIISIIVILSGMIGLIFNQNIVVSILSRFALMLTLCVIFLDKDYRQNFIPDVNKWVVFISILLITAITVFQYSNIFDISNISDFVLTVCFYLIVIVAFFFIIKRRVNKSQTLRKRMILILVMLILLFFIIGINVWLYQIL